MGAAIVLREEYDAEALRRLAARAKDPNQARRLLSLAAIRDGKTRTDGCSLSTTTVRTA